MNRFLTLVDVLQDRGRLAARGITYISGDRHEEYESYGALFDRALCVLHELQSSGMKPGDELLMQIDDNRTFLGVFWGCLLGGIVPVPVTVGNNDEHRMKLFKIWRTLNRPYLMSDAKALDHLEKYAGAGHNELRNLFEAMKQTVLFTDKLDFSSMNRGIIYPAKPEQLAFIQYSSGSTGDPKGVMLTHENLVHNIRDCASGARMDENDSYLGWMPLTHDLGLIAFHLTCAIANADQFIMPTALFIRRPTLWLKKASEHRVTQICSPNFGYKFFLAQYKPEAAADWDLSHIRLVYNGAEPISTEICDQFLDAMEKHGLRRSAMLCVYGMAEACVGVSHPPLEEMYLPVHLNRELLNIGEAVVPVEPSDNRCVTFVDVGYPLASCHIRICDEDDTVLADNVVGHIQISGKNVTAGYYNNPQATAKVKTADGWLKTGDLGFMRSGRLVITGRVKDIIFVNGQNVYPHDIERVAEEVDGVELGKVAVCGVHDAGARQDRIVVFVMHTKKVEDFVPVAQRLRKHLNYRGGWEVHDIVPIRRIPKTTSGKVQRFKLAQEYEEGWFQPVSEHLAELLRKEKEAMPVAIPQNEAEQKLLDICKQILQTDTIGTDESYFELGANSLQLTQMAEQLESRLGVKVAVTDFFSYPTIAKLAAFIAEGERESAVEHDPEADNPAERDIAIIGMSGKFPQADTLEQFWTNLAEGRDCIGPFNEKRNKDAEAYLAHLYTGDRNLQPVEGGYLDEIDTFDYSFFRLTPREASLMDPNQRLFLQTAWSAIEDAGYGGTSLSGKQVGVYVGFSKTSFEYERLLTEVAPEALPHFVIGNLPSILSSRIAYLLDLKGPAVTVDTACSSSLVAVHLACQAILGGDCEMALAGGVKTILLPHKAGIGMESSDDRARAFDDNSDGTGWGEGVGAVLLKPLRQAMQDRDHILAVIKGSAINQDGSTVGISAPNASSQAEVIAQAWRSARVDPETITYIEAHGTGTKLGDPVEIDGLTKAFRKKTQRKQFCALSTVKTNIGHLYEAAGIAGLIKAVLSLQHRQIAPLVHFRQPNRRIGFEASPVYPNTELADWQPNGIPRRCGVSSFGFSGTNCHMVLEEYIPEDTVAALPNPPDSGPLLLTLSARSEPALRTMVGRYAELFERRPELDMRSVCFTANTGRSHLTHRLAVIAAGPAELRAKVIRLHGEGFAGEGVYRSGADVMNSNPSGETSFLRIDTEEGVAQVALQYVQGAKIDWSSLYADRRYPKVSLPTYPFERKRCWIDVPAVRPGRIAKMAALASIGERAEERVKPMNDYSGTGAVSDLHRQSVRISLMQMIRNVSQLDMDELQPQTHFLELGLDSIILTQVRHGIKDTFGLDIPMNSFFESLTNLELLTDYIAQHPAPTQPLAPQDREEGNRLAEVGGPVAQPPIYAPVMPVPASAPASGYGEAPPAAAESHMPLAGSAASAGVERILEQQLRLMSRQLDVLRPHPAPVLAEQREQAVLSAPGVVSRPDSLVHTDASREVAATASSVSVVRQPDSAEAKPFTPFKTMDVKARDSLPFRQEKHLRDLIERYTARTRRTKEYTQKYRSVYANNRNVAGFRPVLKEMVYQIVAERAEGAKIWDLDGNEYIDLTMGFGVNLFGHNPDFIRERIETGLQNGMCVGPMSNLAGQVAEGICKMTGVERIALFNTGTEAVMVALRLARAATGRAKVVLFAGSYHGTFDGVLALGSAGADQEHSVPLAPGVLQHMIDDVVVLNYGTEEALAYLRAHAHELAAVLVEPVQSRRPDFQPQAFLTEVRRITAQSGTAFIFDEVITGFRVHPGGAQAWFGIQADLVTYGKIIGGGMPIGIVGGKAAFMDGIDGGFWRFGDDSYPQQEQRRTFVAGTFCHHPLAMAAALAVLERLEQSEGKLQTELNARTAALASELNDYFVQGNVPMKVVHFGSLFRFVLKGDLELFFYHMLGQGVYIWEGRNCFLSTAHTESDIRRIVQAVKDSIRELRDGGFLPELPPDGDGPGKRPVPSAESRDQGPAAVISLTPEQKQLWFASMSGRSEAQSLHETALLRLCGPLRIEAWSEAVDAVVRRHEALRTYMSGDGETQVVAPELKIRIPLLDVSDCTADAQEQRQREWLDRNAEAPFSMAAGEPLFRIGLLKKSEDEHVALFTFHHLIADGWSMGIFIQELERVYSALVRRESWTLPDPAAFRDYAAWQRQKLEQPESREAAAYWAALSDRRLPALELPSLRRGTSVPTSRGGRHTVMLDSGLAKELKAASIRLGSSLFVTLLSAFQLFLHRLTGQQQITVGIPTAGQAHMEAFSLIGNCVNLLPVAGEIKPELTFAEYAQAVKNGMNEIEPFQPYSFAALAEGGLGQFPPITAVFNMDRLPKLRFHGLDAALLPNPISYSKYELFLNAIEIGSELRLDFDYSADLFPEDTIRAWARYYVHLLQTVAREQTLRISGLSLLSAGEIAQRWAAWAALADMEGSYPCVLDAYLQPVPAGTMGELYVVQPADEGSGNSRNGFLRTGEWVHCAEDGQLTLVGKTSRFIRIRGHRINLQQLEEHVRRTFGLRACAFTARSDADTDTAVNLTAYIVADPSRPWEESELKRAMGAALPDYTQPRYVIKMASLPHTPSGEPDWSQLPEPGAGGGFAATPDIHGGDAAEEALIRIWKEVLGAPRVGRRDNFFQLGGDSLKATVILSRVNKEFQVHIPLAHLFELQTIDELAHYIRGGEKNAYAPIVPVERRDAYPVSSSQKRMYVLQQQGDGITYNVSGQLKIEGQLDTARFIAALREVFGRHESLRTYFALEDGEIVQKISPDADLNVRVTHIGEEEADEVRARFVRPFDLGHAPLFRAELLQFAADRFMLLVDMHHAVADGFSMAVLLDELLQTYQGRQLAPRSVHYKDYAVWQKSRIAEGALQQQETYWLSELGGELPVLNMPTDFPRPQLQSFDGDAFSRKLDPGLTASLYKLAQESGTTLYMVLLAAYNVLLAKYSGQDDIIVGSPVSGRRHADTEAVIGMFVGTLAMRNRPKSEQTFVEFLQDVKRQALLAFEHQDYPFDELADKLGVRDLSRNPIFDTMFMLQNETVHTLEAGGLTFNSEEIHSGVSKFDFSLSVTAGEAGLSCTWEYATKLFKPETIRRMAEHYVRVLEVVVAGQELRLSDLDMLTEAEKRQLHCVSGETALPYPAAMTVCERFEQQAARTPERMALVFGGRTISYRELNRQANRLAHRLQALGVGPDTPVGVCLDRSPELVAGLLAVLKAGGAYVPLDPALPPERLGYMTERAGVKALVTKLAWAEGLAGSPGLTVVCLDDGTAGLEAGPEHNPHSKAEAGHLMYVIYTSGSTGTPKGASVYRSGFENLLQWYTCEFAMTEEDRVLMISSPSFDLTQKNIFAPLVTGGQLVLLPSGPYDAGEVVSLIERHGITLLNGTPSAFYPLLDITASAGYGPLATLRHVFLGGEPIAADRLAAWTASEACRAEVVNTYGPTECTDVTVYGRLTNMPSLVGKPVPIGRPVAGTRVYILNRELALQPMGLPGELCIAGVQVGGGYVGDPEQTADKFVANPYGDELAPVLYRTGDLARYLPDGTIEYLGRIDHQVKLRGYRIEPGEIEAALRECEGVKDAFVMTREDRPGDIRLVAYAVPEEAAKERAASPALWRSELRRKLPDYMVPAAIVVMAELPLSPNGKVDRKALPAPEVGTVTDAGCAAPRTPAEAKLAELWKEVLGLSAAVGVKDNFFDLGGHSLRATTLGAKIHQTLNVSLSLRQMFEHPTLELMAQTIEQLQPSPYADIPVAAQQDTYPLSSAQKRLYILSQLEGAATSYNMPGVLLMEGELDAARLEAAFHGLLRRHATLRTSFETGADGEPVQRIAEKADFMLEHIRVNGEAEAEAAMAGFIRPFDLGKAPLLRAALVEEAPQRHRLLFDMHHLISDGVSMNILLEELAQLYEGTALSPLRIQYKDYAVWQQADSERMSKQEAYWLEQLGGELPILNMPTDYSRPPVRSFSGSTLSFAIDSRQADGLKRLGLQTGATLFMVLLAAYTTLLSKYSGQEDIIVGTPIAGRPHADLQPMIGMFAGTLALRSYPDGEKTFLGYLQEVKELALRAYGHQDYPFETLVEKLNVKRDMSRNPVFDTMFVLQNTETAAPGFTSLRVSPHESKHPVVKFDLTFTAAEEAGGIACGIEYGDRLFKRDTISRMAQHFLQLIEEIIQTPEAKLSSLNILTAHERRQIIETFNETAAPHPADMTVHGLFERQAALTPDRVAVVFEGRRLTYRELDERANRLARTLLAKGVEAEQLVAIMTERSLDMVTAVLGVMKAGGAYVPVDPEYPEERIRYMLGDSGARLLLTQSHLRERTAFGGELLLLDDERSYSGDGSNPGVAVGPHQLAYVIYTSGTTGKPKGVLIEHQGVCNFKLFCEHTLQISERDRVVQFASFSFDAWCSELIMSLFFGATLYVPDASVILDSRLFERYVNDNGITVATLPPAYAVYLSPDRVPGLQKLITAGSASSAELFRQWKDHVRYFNNYGPTEDSICSTAWSYAEDKPMGTTVPIGRPIANHQVYIFDAHNALAPVGVAGELCVAGVGLARGYWNRPELTADKFVPVPFAPERRMYRTGDLARWLPDGSIEYLGRIDHQVKIRGYRIELGEIEAQLLNVGPVQEAIVLARTDDTGQSYLCAYFTADGEQTAGALRSELARKLPGYMLPDFFVQLKQMPLTPNGKIDRQALPAPEGIAHTGSEYVAPRTPVEAKLAELWQEVLGVPGVGIRDHFFELGGHSLRATRLAARIHQELNTQVPLQELFAAPTIEQLATVIGGLQQHAFATIPVAPVQAHYPLSSAQKRLYVLQQFENGEISYNMPGVMLLEGALDRERFEKAFRGLIRRHETLRTGFELVDGEPFQRVYPESEVDFAVDYAECSGGETDTLERIRRFVRPFDLRQPPLLRVGLVRLDQDEPGTKPEPEPERHLLLFDMHHIVSDALSMSILINEFGRLYAGEKLPPLRIHYKDYAAWQQAELTGQRMSRLEAYWLNVFQGELPVLDMPTDYIRPPVRRFEGGAVTFGIGQPESGRLRQIAAQTGSTLYMVLLAAYTTLLHKYTGQEDIVVGTPIAGRPHADLEPMIGMFVNTLALRSYPSGDKTFLDYLKEIREHALKAYEHQDYPFEELVEKLNVKRDRSRSPLFDTMFALENAEQGDLSIEGLTVGPYPSGHDAVKFDLALHAAEVGDELECSLRYASSLYKRETIERMANHFVRLVEAIADSPQAQLAELEMITAAEIVQIRETFNAAAWDRYPRNKTLYAAFEEQAERSKDRVAVVFEGAQLTYGELNERANRMARVLRAHGVTADQPVAMLVERSLEMIVGMLAVLKAGGAYVPIDPRYPEDRIRFVLEDSGASLLLTQARWADKAGFAGQVLKLDDAALYAGPPENGLNLEPVSTASHLAYLIYTSGTTGKPKGVMIEQRSVVNFTFSLFEPIYAAHPEYRNMAQLAPYVFDMSVKPIYGALLLGLTLHIVPEETRLDGGKLLGFFRDHAIDVTDATPTFLSILVQSAQAGEDVGVKHFIVGGEALTTKMVQSVWTTFGEQVKITNVYGPTECTVDSTIYEVEQERAAALADTVPIGRPMPNQSVWILDARQRLLPVGVAGEIHIGGAGVARGYHRRPELTAEKFVPNPYASGSGERMYKTGDLARWLPDGTIEYLGRIDHQVKIRGYRIELGEVEAQLRKMEAVQEAVVTAREDEAGQKQLCAYVVADRELATGEFRKALSQTLPEYMIPLYFVQLPQLPLTPNGKVDRKALPVPRKGKTSETDYVAPRTAVEQALASAWQAVLGIKKVGVNDSFFALGGDSIKAIQVAAKLHQAGYKMEMRHLFANPAIAELSAHVQPMTRTADQREVKGRVRLTPIQAWFFRHHDAAPHHYNQAVMLYREQGYDEAALRKTMQKLAEHHDALRTVFRRTEGGYAAWTRGIDEGELYSMEVVDFRPAAENAAQAIETKANDIQSSIELSTGPLMKLGLFRCADGDHLLIVVHHLVVDGVSWRILLEDLASGYEQAASGQAIRLPDKTDAFRTWAEQLAGYANSPAMEAERTYWQQLEQLESKPLPRDFAQAGQEQAHGLMRDSETVTVQWTQEETELLLKRTHRAYNTDINDLLLTALGMAVYRWTGIERVWVSLEGHGRESILPDIDITRTVGWFTSEYPVALEMGTGGSSCVSDTLAYRIKRVKDGLRQIPHKGIGYGILKYLSDTSENARFAAKPEIRFNYLGQFDQDLTHNALQVSPYAYGAEIGGQTARSYALYISGSIADGELALTVGYSGKQYRRETMERLAGLFHSSLQEIIAHCAAKERPELTPSDVVFKGLALTERMRRIGEIESVHRLTPLQQGMLYHRLLDPESEAYFGQTAFTVHGSLDIQAFKQSLDAVVQRHDALRTNLYSGWNGQPLQAVYRSKPADFVYEDIREREESEQEAHINALMKADKVRGFELGEESLLRVSIVQTCDKTYRFLCSFCQIVIDGRDMARIIEEVFAAYSAFRKQARPELGPATPYRRYIEWLEGQDPAAASAYWSQYLAGYGHQAVLPRIKAREQQATRYAAERLTTSLGKRLIRQMRATAKRQQVSVNTLIQTAWGLLLQAYNGTDDVVFGTVVPVRPAHVPVMEAMIGVCGNTIPVRIRSGDGATLADVMRGAQEQAAASEKYAMHPLYEIQALAVRKRELINHILVLETDSSPSAAAEAAAKAAGLEMNGFRTEGHTSYDLTVILQQGDDMRIQFDYNAQVYEREAMERLLGHWMRIMEQLAANPDVRVQELRLPSPAERKRLPTGLGGSTAKPPQGAAGHSLSTEGVASASAEFVPPRTPVEAKLAELWQEVLGAPRIGVRDHFFELGGHSIKAMQLTEKVNTVMGAALSLRAVLAAPTIEEMAGLLSSGLLQADGDGPMKLNERGRMNVFCFPPSAGYGIVYAEMARMLEEQYVVYAFDFIEGWRDYEEMLNRYVDAIVSVQREAPYVLLGYSLGGSLAFEVAKTMERRGYAVSDILLIDADRRDRTEKKLSDEELERGVDDMLRIVAERDASFLANQADREKARTKILAYATYSVQLVNEGVVQANLHAFVAEMKNARAADWKEATTEQALDYDLIGGHLDIFEPAHIEHNVHLIRLVLQDIVRGKSLTADSAS
ncbi:amino acid adenylation domain-containing protein [Paenibacillus ehimensis]|uniref:non-ribosomal peptide synthetase n=1 Tax=Paenibacillus ehimensis TaxID=79264 RepID=UPI002DBCA8B8|nr:non-ribosomal peptide synthetase [Paenibacillus ehimensis]MEC0210153.1 amino acid adenylation domain-containing protein [Paenibacillus ehimensis]